MKKKSLEILTSIASVMIFIILIIIVSFIMPASSRSYGYATALLVFIVIMGIMGLKLAEIPN